MISKKLTDNNYTQIQQKNNSIWCRCNRMFENPNKMTIFTVFLILHKSCRHIFTTTIVLPLWVVRRSIKIEFCGFFFCLFTVIYVVRCLIALHSFVTAYEFYFQYGIYLWNTSTSFKFSFFTNFFSRFQSIESCHFILQSALSQFFFCIRFWIEYELWKLKMHFPFFPMNVASNDLRLFGGLHVMASEVSSKKKTIFCHHFAIDSNCVALNPLLSFFFRSFSVPESHRIDVHVNFSVDWRNLHRESTAYAEQRAKKSATTIGHNGNSTTSARGRQTLNSNYRIKSFPRSTRDDVWHRFSLISSCSTYTEPS